MLHTCAVNLRPLVIGHGKGHGKGNDNGTDAVTDIVTYAVAITTSTRTTGTTTTTTTTRHALSIHIQALPHVQFYHRKVYIRLSSKLADGGLDLCVSPVRTGAGLSFPTTTLACFVYIPGASMGQRQRPSRPFRRS